MYCNANSKLLQKRLLQMVFVNAVLEMQNLYVFTSYILFCHKKLQKQTAKTRKS